jgi:hypothetical protein
MRFRVSHLVEIQVLKEQKVIVQEYLAGNYAREYLAGVCARVNGRKLRKRT